MLIVSSAVRAQALSQNLAASISSQVCRSARARNWVDERYALRHSQKQTIKLIASSTALLSVFGLWENVNVGGI